MKEEQKKKIGRKLSLVLRHQPQIIGITLDEPRLDRSKHFTGKI